MVRPRHAARSRIATRLPPILFLLLCVAVAGCVERTEAVPGTFAAGPAAAPLDPSSNVPTASDVPGGSDVPAATPLPEPTDSPSPTPSPTPTDPGQYRGVTAIGDSVMVDAAPNLRSTFPGITIDAVAGRQVDVGIAAMQNLANTGRLGTTVVIGLGTNGPFSSGQFDRIVALAGGRRMIFLTNHCAYCTWVTRNNELILGGCLPSRDCTIADWQALAGSNPAWFYTDGVHMPIGGIGGQAFADLVGRSLVASPPIPRSRLHVYPA